MRQRPPLAPWSLVMSREEIVPSFAPEVDLLLQASAGLQNRPTGSQQSWKRPQAMDVTSRGWSGHLRLLGHLAATGADY